MQVIHQSASLDRKMQRGTEQAASGLGPQLAGEKIHVKKRSLSVIRQLGEGGFSFVYLVKDLSENDTSVNSSNTDVSIPDNSNDKNTTNNNNKDSTSNNNNINNTNYLVLKITSIHSRQQRDIAEKEAKLLSRLSHPSIVQIFDSCYRTIHNIEKHGKGGNNDTSTSSSSHHPSGINNATIGSRPQHLILMEYCEGGTALSVCNDLKSNSKRFDLQSLIIAFGQICNAVSYLHAQRPPIVHRDLKPVNFLVKNGAYKLCDFGSVVFGSVDLKTARARNEAEEVIQKTTTQMFRAPEMVDLYMSEKLTKSTDVWALGCCLYSLAFLKNCFEEGSNLAILSKNYRIPDDNPYGDDLAELIERMLTINCEERADMTEIILCLSAIYSGRSLPPRKKVPKKESKGGSEGKNGDKNRRSRVGRYRTDGQGIRDSPVEDKKPVEAKKLNPNSAAARRRRAAKTTDTSNNLHVPISLNRSASDINHSKNTMFDSSFGDFSNFKNDSIFSSTDDPFKIGGSKSSLIAKENGDSSRSRSFDNFKQGYDSQDDGFDFTNDINGMGFEFSPSKQDDLSSGISSFNMSHMLNNSTVGSGGGGDVNSSLEMSENSILEEEDEEDIIDELDDDIDQSRESILERSFAEVSVQSEQKKKKKFSIGFLRKANSKSDGERSR